MLDPIEKFKVAIPHLNIPHLELESLILTVLMVSGVILHPAALKCVIYVFFDRSELFDNVVDDFKHGVFTY